jgi:hypothetical protein
MNHFSVVETRTFITNLSKRETEVRAARHRLYSGAGDYSQPAKPGIRIERRSHCDIAKSWREGALSRAQA